MEIIENLAEQIQKHGFGNAATQIAEHIENDHDYTEDRQGPILDLESLRDRFEIMSPNDAWFKYIMNCAYYEGLDYPYEDSNGIKDLKLCLSQIGIDLIELDDNRVILMHY